MSGNLNIALWLRLYGNDAAAAGMRRFTESTKHGFGQVSASIKQAWQDMNGYSTATKLLAAAGGMSLVRNAIDANLEFEKKILEMKQLAEMTQAQAASLRQAAIDRSTDLLTTPQDIAEGMRVLANASMKYDAIAGTIEEAARAALAFRSTVTDIANMDFDIQTKFNIDPSRMAAMHDMLYYHSKQGRFEAKSLSTYAPEYLSEMSSLGMSGEKSLNFAGALTQQLQKIKAATQPGEVATLIKHGLGHITQPHYVKSIAKATGIDVEHQFFDDKGKLKGEGGMDGLLGMARALKAKGLDNVFKLGRAGFRDKYTAEFWLQLMRNLDEIEAQMKLADGAVSNATLNKDVSEIKGSNFGRVKKGQIQVDKAKLGDGVTKGADWWGRMSEYFADNSGEVMAGGAGLVGLYMASRYNKNRKARIGAQAAAQAGGVGLGVQQVFVTNWPGGVGAPGGGMVGGVGPNAGAQQPQSKFGKAVSAAGKGLGGLAAGASGLELGYNIIGPVINEGINALVSAMTKEETSLGSLIYEMLHKKELEAIRQPIIVQNNIHLSGEQIASSVNEVNARTAKRN